MKTMVKTRSGKGKDITLNDIWPGKFCACGEKSSDRWHRMGCRCPEPYYIRNSRGWDPCPNCRTYYAHLEVEEKKAAVTQAWEEADCRLAKM